MSRVPPEMLTPRLRLRELIADDVDGIFRLYSQPETMRYWSCPPYRERRQAEELLTRVAQGHEAGDLLEWGVELLDSGRLIGTLTLHQLDVGNQRAELGYLLERDFWGRGLMGEALLPVLQFAFDDRGLGLHRLEADTDPRNTGSVKLLERLGFRLEGLLRERWCVAGEFSDSAMFGLLRREWQTGRAAE